MILKFLIIIIIIIIIVVAIVRYTKKCSWYDAAVITKTKIIEILQGLFATPAPPMWDWRLKVMLENTIKPFKRKGSNVDFLADRTVNGINFLAIHFFAQTSEHDYIEDICADVYMNFMKYMRVIHRYINAFYDFYVVNNEAVVYIYFTLDQKQEMEFNTFKASTLSIEGDTVQPIIDETSFDGLPTEEE